MLYTTACCVPDISLAVDVRQISCPKPALTLWKKTFLKMGIQSVQQDSCQDLAGNREQRYASVVITALSAAFILKRWIMEASLNSLGIWPFSPKEAKRAASRLTDVGAVALSTSAGMASDPGAFPLDS